MPKHTLSQTGYGKEFVPLELSFPPFPALQPFSPLFLLSLSLTPPDLPVFLHLSMWPTREMASDQSEGQVERGKVRPNAKSVQRAQRQTKR